MKIIDFFFAARPICILPVWSVYLIMQKFYYGARPSGYETFFILVGLSLMTAGVYFINQIYDFEGDRINDKVGFLQRRFIKRTEMTAAYIAVSFIPIAAAFIYNYQTGILFLILVILGYCYSAPPFRFKDRPLAGLLTNGVGYGLLVPLAIPGLLASLKIEYFYMVLFFFLMLSAGYLLTTIPDREGDRAVGKKTIAFYCSNTFILTMALIMMLLALYAVYKVKHIYLIIIALVSILLLVLSMFVKSERILLFTCKFPIFLLTLLAGYYYPTYLVFIVVLLILIRVYYKRRFNMIYPRLD